MSDQNLSQKIIQYAKRKGYDAMVKLGGECIIAVLYNKRGKQYYISAVNRRELIHKVKCTA